MGTATIHPELRRAAALLPRGGIGPRTLRPIRALTTVSARRGARHATVERVGAVDVWLFRPPGAGAGPHPALLWVHGGGYVIGSPAQDAGQCRRMAERLGIVVAAVDYRLAPEHRFPEPLHDCHDALRWLADRPDVDPARVAIGGASAGGGLAAALALLARQRGEVSPVFQLLSYPMLDDRTVTRRDVDVRSLRLWNPRANRFGWSAYLGRPPGGPDVDPLAAPARATDLSGLPPAWVGVGTADLFHDEDVAYAERLQAAGVPCQLDVVEGAFHGFDGVVPKAPVSRAYRQAMVTALAAGLGV